jgi:glycosyltransferase involved in cell wall biosynthesis/SAM-dependent methyltransferase
MPAACDALILVFTEGVSLRDWERGGVLDREWALYSHAGVGPQVGSIVLVTYGEPPAADGGAGPISAPRDVEIGRQLGVTVVCNEGGESRQAFLAGVPRRVRDVVGGAARIIVKTNQFKEGEVALAIASELRGVGKTVGVIARGGYPWSRFEAREKGAASAAAMAASEREGRLVRGADVVIGTTPEMAEDLAWRYGVDRGRFEVVPNYILCRAWDPQSRAGTAEVLFAGRLERQKRVDRLLEAMALVPAELGARLTVIGEGSEQADLKVQAARLGVDATFEPRMGHGELLERMARCAVYCQSSDFEGHPKTVLEALGAGAPVVVCDTPGLREAIKDARTGLVVAPEPGAIAEAIELLLRDRGLGHALGAAAAAWARQALALDRVVPLELATYATALQRGEGVEAKPDISIAVRFDPGLLGAGRERAVEAWTRAVRGFARRLPSRERAEFIAALDTPLYHLQGEVALEAAGGLHPKHRLMRYHDFFVDRIGGGEWVIDLGCGVGALAASMAERARAHVTGMDWSRTNLERAERIAGERGLTGQRVEGSRARGTISYLHGDITRDRAAGTFDAVVLSNVLEHLTDRPARLRTWREWYEPSRFLLRVPAFDREWRAPWKRELGVEWRLDPTHETEYTQEQLERELREAGLRVTEMIVRWGEYWCVAGPA